MEKFVLKMIEVIAISKDEKEAEEKIAEMKKKFFEAFKDHDLSARKQLWDTMKKVALETVEEFKF